MRLKDNCRGQECDQQIYEDLKTVGNRSISEIIEENKDLLIFPQSLNINKDRIGDNYIFSSYEKNNSLYLRTYNMMGFIGKNNSQLTISSRFDNNEKNYFLYYMLEKVFSINLFDLPDNVKPDAIWDKLLMFLFPYYLKKALGQGVYKGYVNKKNNDASPKGAIDINRHIKTNIPFNGKVAYNTREFSFDNRITQLIRHTQECIAKYFSFNILASNTNIRNGVQLIEKSTPSYNKQNRSKIIHHNLRTLNHPYFSEYEPLRKLCLRILHRDSIAHDGNNNDKIHGILFDGAWLWEEYLNTMLGTMGFVHPENRLKSSPIYLFTDNKGIRYPDFYSQDKTIVLDAKYKSFENWNSDNEANKDIYQIISYLHCLKSRIGAFIFPNQENANSTSIGELNGYGGEVRKIAFAIPNVISIFLDFRQSLHDAEETFKEDIRKL